MIRRFSPSISELCSHYDVHGCHSQQRKTQPLCKLQGIPTSSAFVVWQYRVGNIFFPFLCTFFDWRNSRFQFLTMKCALFTDHKFQKLHIAPDHNCNSLETGIYMKSIRIVYEAWLVLYRSWLIFYQNFTFTNHWLVIYQNIFMLRISILSLCSDTDYVNQDFH